MSNDANLPAPQGEFLIYQTADGHTRVQVRFERDTVWLSQRDMAELFQTTKQNVRLHIQNVFDEGELLRDGTVKEYLTVQTEGNCSNAFMTSARPSGSSGEKCSTSMPSAKTTTPRQKLPNSSSRPCRTRSTGPSTSTPPKKKAGRISDIAVYVQVFYSTTRWLAMMTEHSKVVTICDLKGKLLTRRIPWPTNRSSFWLTKSNR